MRVLYLLILAAIITGMVCQLDFRPAPWTSPYLPMVLVDGRYRSGPPTIDTFYDRIVSITTFIRDPKRGVTVPCVATGVFITRMLVLTSFNAFRLISKRKDTLQHMYVEYIIGRQFLANNSTRPLYYTTEVPDNRIHCARQVVPDFDKPVPSHMRHGPHRPQHDLMVLRLQREVDVGYRPSITSFYYYNKQYYNSNSGLYEWKMKPIRTVLARKDDELGDNIRFASVGHVNDRHIRQHRFLNKMEYNNLNEKVVTDCEEWFPREWGHFICVLNVNNFPGLASGAMLFSGEKLFGVGSFALFKGTKGVLVFTDVRPYWHLFYQTCTRGDQSLIIPPTTTAGAGPIYYSEDDSD